MTTALEYRHMMCCWASLFFGRGGVQRIILQIEGAVAEMAAVSVHIVFVAGKFVEFLAGRHGREDSGKRPGLGIELRILHGHFVRQMIRVGARPVLDNVHGVAMRMRVVVDPTELVLESDRIDDQRVSVPLAYAVAEERRFDVLGMFPAVRGDRSKGPHQFIEESDAVRILDDFEWNAADAGPRYAREEAKSLRINGMTQVVFVSLFACSSEWRSSHAFEHAAEDEWTFPEAG